MSLPLLKAADQLNSLFLDSSYILINILLFLEKAKCRAWDLKF
jgi:hypothetical protein